MASPTTTANPGRQQALCSSPEGSGEPRHRASPSPTRREDIVDAARELYEEKGLTKTTVCDITDRVGVSRTLFYHYFPDKDAVTSAVIDGYVDDFVEAAHAWNKQREEGSIDDALESFIRLGRSAVFENDAFHQALATRENAGLYLEFASRAIESLARYLCETTVEDYAALHEVQINHVYETLYVVIYGLIGYGRAHPEADDAMLADIVAQTLHIARGSTEGDVTEPDGG